MRSFACFEDDFLTGSSTAHAFELEGLFQNDLRRDLVDDAAMLDLRNPGCAKTRMRLIGRHAFIDHRHANIGNKLLDATRVLARPLRGDPFSPAQVPRKSNDHFDRVVATNDIGQAIKVGQIGGPVKGFNRHREDAVRVAPADADTHGADVHADTNTPTNTHSASISLRIASIASAIPSGLVPPP